MDEEKKTQGEEIPGKAEAEGPAAEDRRTTDAPDVQTDAPQTAQTNAAPEDESEDDEGGEGRHGASGDSIANELLPVSLETEMRQSYLDYAMSVIVGRALPDVRDGLKPVHRRVLYAMKEIGNVWSSPTKKAARVVGEVLGKFHPHGDSAAYQTIVRMAQDFSMRYPLIYGQGNFGSIDGDSAAAMRYTEVKLMKIAEEMLADLHEDTVDFVPNFDNSEVEPVVLPTRLPELLVNGSSGIAVGMATNIPPHNLRETIDACVHALEHPDCSVDDLIALISAPDFPTGGIVYGLSGVYEGYRTGRGRVIMRARTHLEEFGRDHSRTRIVVDEIPYMVNKRVLYERMHELWRDKKLDGISEMRDESTRQIRIAIDLKQGAMPEVVLNNLFKNTQMQESFGMNMVALVDGQPMLLNLKQMVVYFLEHRREVVTRRTIFRLKKSRGAGHILAGQAIALANIDEFIRLIRAAKTVEEAQQSLMGRGWPLGFAAEITRRAAEYGKDADPEGLDPRRGLQPDGLYYLTKVQVDNILAMNLRRLTREMNIGIIDATCPVVARLQRRVKEAHERMRPTGGQVVILGKRGHAEVVGLTGQVADPTIVIEREEDLELIDFSRQVYFLSQTTQSIGLFERLGAEMRRRAADAGQVYIDDTICRQVSNREQHLTEFSGRFDAVVFVCGRKSSNGKVLSEVCRRANPRTHVVEEASEIDPAWFEGAATVGICGATSTPKWLMQDVADAIGNINSEFKIQNS